WHPDEFAALKQQALALGFRHVESGPLVRSSYHAEEQAGLANVLAPRRVYPMDVPLDVHIVDAKA
ncbi:MAG: hypothetical protein WED87_00780, partial [Dehalococcoidia bacterium]